MSSTDDRESWIIRQALERTAAERAAFLDGACGADKVLRQRLEGLIAEDNTVADSLESSADSPTVEHFSPMNRTEHSVEELEGTLIDRYKLVERLGEGGFGDVWLADQKEPVRRKVALKIIKLGMHTKQVIARFDAERQALALMDHPNIARVLDAGATELGRPYFVMELVRGIRITDYCDKAALGTRDRLELFIKVCQAIQHAHQKGVIHRDIKASNVMVAEHDGVPVPKVIDFGIAKATQGVLTDQTIHTRNQQFIGTPAYMSPEQAELSELDIDTRADIYSLGVLLYELLVGSTPFDARELISKGIDAMRKTIREDEPPRPSTRLAALEINEQTTTAKSRNVEPAKLIHQLQGDLDWIVMKCLEKERQRRYATANGLAAEVRRYLSHEPVLACPPSASYRIQKAWRRNKTVFTAGAAVVLALVAGLALAAIGWHKTGLERDNANQATRQAEESQREAVLAQQAEKEQRERAEQGETRASQLLYIANMNLAQQYWDQDNVARIRDILTESELYPDRGFEWNFWQQRIHSEIRTFAGHLAPVAAVAFFPGGERIVTASEDQSAVVWVVADGREMLKLRGHTAPIRSIAVSPTGDRIVTGSDDHTAKVWNAASGRELFTLKGHSATIESVSFSPDGLSIVTGSWDHTARIWEAADEGKVLTLSGHQAEVRAVSYSPDGQRVATAGQDQTAKVWDVETGRNISTLTGHTNNVWSVGFSPDGRRLVTGSADHTVRLWDLDDARENLTLLGHKDEVRSAEFSPDGQYIVSASEDQTAKLWNLETAEPIRTFRGHTDGVWAVTFDRAGQRIVTGSEDRTAKVWDTKAEPDVITLTGHEDGIRSLTCSPDGMLIATGSQDFTARIWERDSGRELRTLRGHTVGLRSVAFSPDGRHLLTASEDLTARVWDVASGQELLTLKGHTAGIRAAVYSPDGQYIVTGSMDQTAKSWDAASGRELATFRGHFDMIMAVAFDRDGQRFVTASEDETATLWDLSSARALYTFDRHVAPIWSLAFSSDGSHIVTVGTTDRTARVWEAANGNEFLSFKGHTDEMRTVAFSPDGNRILTGSRDQTVKLWELTSGREVLTLKGHTGGMRSVVFTPDGRHIITGGDDGTARIWSSASPDQVAAWREEERNVVRHLSDLEWERELELEKERDARARDEGALKQWLVLAPISLSTERSGAQALDENQIPQEPKFTPRQNDQGSVEGAALAWQLVRLKDYVLDFNELLGQPTVRSVAYAVCYLRSETDQSGLRMLVGCDDEAKLYLNSEEVFKWPFARKFEADQHAVENIHLRAGINVIVFKVVNAYGGWKGSIRLTDSKGEPVKGITATLDPSDLSLNAPANPGI